MSDTSYEKVVQQTQLLATSPLVELYQIDISGLTSITGQTAVPGVNVTQTVWYFTPGTLPQVQRGQLTGGSNQVLLLDRVLTFAPFSLAEEAPESGIIALAQAYLDHIGVPVTPSASNGYSVTVSLPDGSTQTVAITAVGGEYPTVSQYGASGQTAIATTDAGGNAPPDVAAAGPRNYIILSAPLRATPDVGASYTVTGPGVVSFGGVTYNPLPISGSGFEKSAQGKLPRPKLRIDNTTVLPGSSISVIAGLVIGFGDILGAKVTRLRTFADFLDGSPTADHSAHLDLEVYYVDRKSAHNKSFIEFELTSDFDQIGLKLPARQVIRDICGHTYRRWDATTQTFIQGSCPWRGAPWVELSGQTLNVAENDIQLDQLVVLQPNVTYIFTISWGDEASALTYAYSALVKADQPGTLNGITPGPVVGNCVVTLQANLPYNAPVGASWAIAPLPPGATWPTTPVWANTATGLQTTDSYSPISSSPISSSLYGPYYDFKDAATLQASSDSCSHLFSGCVARFGKNPLPMRAFPGVQQV